MDNRVQRVLDEYEARSLVEGKRSSELSPDVFTKERDEFLLAVGPATGQFMNLLIKEARCRTILEIGTSYGYSTVWLAEAARAVGGRVITLELQARKQDYARESLSRAGLEDFVDFRSGDALASLERISEPVDFVLLDLWKDLYIPCFDLFHPKLSAGAIVVADNMTYPESAQVNAARYREHVRAKPDVQSMLLPIGSGLEVTRIVHGVTWR